MDFEPTTIAEQIECLARLTGATASFVTQVQKLFSSKGISLDADATPYIMALEEAFNREETIRVKSENAQTRVKALRGEFQKLGETYTRQMQQLRQVQLQLKKQRKAGDRTPIVIPGDHRTYVTRQQSETQPMVPGPEEIQ